MCQCGGPQGAEPIAARGLSCKHCGDPGSQSRMQPGLPAFVSRQPPRSTGEFLLQRIFARDTGLKK